MRTFIKILGVIWLAMGLLNIVLMPWADGSSGLIVFGLIFNVLVFVMPGAVLYSIGEKKPVSA